VHFSAPPKLKYWNYFWISQIDLIASWDQNQQPNLRVAGGNSPDGPEPPSGHPPPKSHNVYY